MEHIFLKKRKYLEEIQSDPEVYLQFGYKKNKNEHRKSR